MKGKGYILSLEHTRKIALACVAYKQLLLSNFMHEPILCVVIFVLFSGNSFSIL